jgi:hypothetical protein
MRTVHGFVRSLNVKVEDLIGLSQVFDTQNQVARLTFVGEAPCAAFLEKFEGLKNVKLENKNIRVLIKDTNVGEKFVRISGIPHSMDLGVIQTRFKEFGKILDLRWERYHVAEDKVLYPILSTWLICRMTIEKAIPSYVTIGEYRAIVKYNGQKTTCGICDETDHLRRDCPRLRRNKPDNSDKTETPTTNFLPSVFEMPSTVGLTKETNTAVVEETVAESVVEEAPATEATEENEMVVEADDSASTTSQQETTQDILNAIPAGQKQKTQTTQNDVPSASATISSVSSGSDTLDDNYFDIETDPSWSTVNNKRKERSPQRPKASGESKDPLSLSPRQQQKLAKLISKDTFTRLAEIQKNKSN